MTATAVLLFGCESVRSLATVAVLVYRPGRELFTVSVKVGGDVGTVSVGGRIRTSGDNVVSVEIEGNVGHIVVAGGISAEGARSDAVHVRGKVAGLDEIAIRSASGHAIVHRD